jgi:hypothetical protein
MIVKPKKPMYSFTTQMKVDAELPQCIKDAMNKSGWNSLGIYELVKTVLKKERAAIKEKKG